MFFWAGDPLKVNFKAPNSQKARVRNRTRRLSCQACDRLKIATCRRDEETEKKYIKNIKSTYLYKIIDFKSYKLIIFDNFDFFNY